MSTTKKSALGRGFESLIPQGFDKAFVLEDKEKIQDIAVEKITPNGDQPRKHFDEGAIEQLAQSIKRYGVIQPLVVSPLGDGLFTIIAGERRWRASQLAGLKAVPVVIRTSKELERLEIAIVENVQRVDLSPLEQASSIERLHQQFNMKYDEIATRLAKAPSTVNNIVRLLQLPEPALDALRDKKISEGHARAILSIKNDSRAQLRLLELIAKNEWSVRQAEQYALSVKEGTKENPAKPARLSTETPATKALSKTVGAPVHIRRTAKGGKLEIIFKSDEELEQILSQLTEN